MLTALGMNHLLDTYFGNVVYGQKYVGLISGNIVSDPADIMSSHVGWVEFTGYAETTRPQLLIDNAVAGIATAVSPATVTLSQDATITGLFICDASVKSGATGTLFSVMPFGVPVVAVSGDIIQLPYSFTLAEAVI